MKATSNSFHIPKILTAWGQLEMIDKLRMKRGRPKRKKSVIETVYVDVWWDALDYFCWALRRDIEVAKTYE